MKQTSSTKHIPASDEAPKLTAKDLARAHLRVGLKDVSPDEFRAAVNERLGGKKRISIMLDSAVIAFFKAKAGEKGYQTLINEALKDAVRGVQIEDAVRKVVREELAHH